ncbi:MAG: biopolymer transporter ExbD [Phycisphaerae bacterium]|nr:biopolymer transporter ExbD [Phycisphaerae bacterium]
MRRKLEPAVECIPNLAPMVDVIMVLLIFFLLGASLDLAKQGILQTELDPSSGPGAGVAVEINPLIRIALADVEDGTGAFVFLNEEGLGELVDRPYSLTMEKELGRRAALRDYFGALYQRLEAAAGAGADRDNPVVIGAETNVRWKYVTKAMDAAVNAGFKNIQFAVSFRAGSLGG